MALHAKVKAAPDFCLYESGGWVNWLGHTEGVEDIVYRAVDSYTAVRLRRWSCIKH